LDQAEFAAVIYDHSIASEDMKADSHAVPYSLEQPTDTNHTTYCVMAEVMWNAGGD